MQQLHLPQMGKPKIHVHITKQLQYCKTIFSMMFNIFTTFITSNFFYRYFNTHKSLFTQIQVLQFRIDRIKHWDIFLLTRAACIGVVNTKHRKAHELNIS